MAVVQSLESRRLLAGPIVITQGGTYTGNWENVANDSPVVTIKTAQPVVFNVPVHLEFDSAPLM